MNLGLSGTTDESYSSITSNSQSAYLCATSESSFCRTKVRRYLKIADHRNSVVAYSQPDTEVRFLRQKYAEDSLAYFRSSARIQPSVSL
jgi:hypothetical protein